MLFYPPHVPKALAAVTEMLQTGGSVKGPRVAQFEQEFANQIPRWRQKALAVGSGIFGCPSHGTYSPNPVMK